MDSRPSSSLARFIEIDDVECILCSCGRCASWKHVYRENDTNPKYLCHEEFFDEMAMLLDESVPFKVIPIQKYDPIRQYRHELEQSLFGTLSPWRCMPQAPKDLLEACRRGTHKKRLNRKRTVILKLDLEPFFDADYAAPDITIHVRRSCSLFNEFQRIAVHHVSCHGSDYWDTKDKDSTWRIACYYREFKVRPTHGLKWPMLHKPSVFYEGSYWELLPRELQDVVWGFVRELNTEYNPS